MSNKESAQCAMSKLTDVRGDAKDRIDTGCSLNIVFFENVKIYSGLWPLSIFPRCVHRTSCLDHLVGGRTPALLQNWQS